MSTKPIIAGTAESSVDVNTGRWTAKEHLLFIDALRVHGQDWRRIAVELKTRNNIQVRTHAQKYFKKLERLERRAAGFSGSSSRVPSAIRAATKATLANVQDKGKNYSSEDEDDDVEDDEVTETTTSDSESSNGEEDSGARKTSTGTPPIATVISNHQQHPLINFGPAISQQTLSLLAMLRPLPPPPRAVQLAQAGLPLVPSNMHLLSAPVYASSLVGSNWQSQEIMQQVGTQRPGFPMLFHAQHHATTLMNPNAIFSSLSTMPQPPIQSSQYMSTPSRFQ